MTTSSLADTMFAALKEGLRQPDLPGAIPTARHQPRIERSLFDTKKAVGEFKIRWIYSDKSTYGAASTKAFGSHLFLFHKNLSVTDITSAEIFALIKRKTNACTTYTADGGPIIPDFLDDPQYTRYIENLLLPFAFDAKVKGQEVDSYLKRISEEVTELHEDFFYKTISFDRLFNSALMHIPRSLVVDCQAVVAESGYIHSAGHSIYARRAEKTSTNEITQNLEEFLAAHPGRTFALEAFSENFLKSNIDPEGSSELSSSIRNGIDGHFFEFGKQYIGSLPLTDVLPILEECLSDKIDFDGLSIDSHSPSTETHPASSIFLLYDSRFIRSSSHNASPNSDRLIFLFNPYIFNANQLTLFKERKPAWAGPVTLPHTLSAAIVNILHPVSGDVKRSPLIIDPFCGTGTCLFDTAIRIPNARIVGFDRNTVSPVLVRDNLAFLSADGAQLKEIWDFFSRFESEVAKLIERNLDGTAKRDRIVDEFKERVKACAVLIGSQFDAVEAAQGSAPAPSPRVIFEEGFDRRVAERLRAGSLQENLVFYLTWRAMASAAKLVGFDGNGDYDEDNLLREVFARVAEFQRLTRQLMRLKDEEIRARSGAYNLVDGRWAPRSTVSDAAWRKFVELSPDQVGAEMGAVDAISVVNVEDSVAALSGLPNAVDAIVGDPPYWFNTEATDAFAAQKFYSDFVDAAVRALRPGGGKLALAVLQYSRNGRTVPFYQTRGAVTRKVLSSAEKYGKQLINVAQANGGRASMSDPPFFWNSRSVLSRRILLFTVR